MSTAVEKIIETLTTKAKELAVSDVRIIKTINVGESVRQGDIYIHCVDKDHAHGKVIQKRQLAIGESKGSRHILEGENVTVFEGTTQPEWCTNSLLGPCIALNERSLISHPEHSNVEMPAGLYQITHQMDARTLERVKD